MKISHDFILRLFADIVGPDYVSDDLAICEAYSKDGLMRSVQRKYKKDPTSRPEFVVLPDSTKKVRDLLRIADRYGLKVIPITSGVNMTGLCIAGEPHTICLDLKRMDKILEINEDDMTATIQPYVSYARLQAETMKRGLWTGGTPLAPSIVGVISNMMYSGGSLWQSALAYGFALRSLLSVTVVLPNGDILKTGSSTLPHSGSFWWNGPGPDLKGIFELGHCGEFGVVTEATVKLHPWAGGDWPKEKQYDQPELPARHKIFFVEYPEFNSMAEAMYEIAHSGIGTHLNALSNAWSAATTQPTAELTEKRFKEGYFPKHLIYVVLAGITSEKQLDYEERVLSDIVEETGGKFRFDLENDLATWNADAFRAGDTVRVTRLGSYNVVRFPYAPINYQKKVYEVQHEILKKYPHHILEDHTPFTYVIERGYYSGHETDTYFDQANPEDIMKARNLAKEGFIIKTPLDGLGWVCFLEPITTIFGPKIGPNFNLLLKKIKKVFDPNSTMNPGKLVS